MNASNVAVGSVNAGSDQRGVIYNGGSATIITQTTTNGSFFLTAFGINDSGRIVGQGIDPENAARNVGIVYDIGQNMAFEVGALPGHNGALAFGVSNNGYVVGSSMQNQGPACHSSGRKPTEWLPFRSLPIRVSARLRGELVGLGSRHRWRGVRRSLSV